MARDIIDDRLIGALHLRALTLRGIVHDPAAEHVAVQAGTIDALMEGKYEGDVTLDEVIAHGAFGIGTVQQLGGELVIVDGEPWLVDANREVSRVPGSTLTPFAVVCDFVADVARTVDDELTWAELTALIDDAVADVSPVVAVRVRGTFAQIQLRSVHRQTPPYPSLSDVAAHQVQWSVNDVTGTLIGFRFPDSTSGVEVPGYHLHFLSDDRSTGGHVMSLTLSGGVVEASHIESLHVELPPGVQLGEPGGGDSQRIAAAEGQH